MTGPRYLIRMDDACDTMDHGKWAAVERVLDRHAVKPIVAVVPENHDPALAVGERDERFWDRVRSWADKGWIVGMHGCTHLMHATATPLLVPFYQRSEFAGLTLDEQRVRIRTAWSVFLAHGVTPRVWVAPAHSFDVLTLEALRSETSIRIVSDGIALNTYSEHGFQWIPQQLFGSFAVRPPGLWTLCLHPNTMSEGDIAALDKALSGGFGERMTRFDAVRLSQRPKGPIGRIYHRYFWWRWRNRSDKSASGRRH